MSTPSQVCPIDVNQPNKVIRAGHLRLGGSDPAGNRLAVTNTYVTWNDRPYFLISGEFHYSRFPESEWETELLKIKAGGVNTVATYIFWSCHEEQPGVFDWSGSKNLRRFVELCGCHKLHVIIRIGPFAHGEWRNGGLPDWLYGQPFEVRSNAPGYLAYVERFYHAIEAQVHGLLFREGGPILGIQLENEYMHAGAPWEVVEQNRPVEWITAGHEGAAHLSALKKLAHQAGLEAPLYLVTAWGSPIIEDETLPVYGGYAYPVWVDEPGPSELFTFKDGHAQPAATVSHHLPNYYPLVYAEMQGGIQIRYNNRPVVPARSVEALALVCIGNGSNWLGYYMYHGGTTPMNGHGYSHERLHPQLSYDFQAPLGEYGEYHASYYGLKLLHHFLLAYGEALGSMGTFLPADAQTLRYCVRSQDGGGFLFVNNFQDHGALPTQTGVVFELHTPLGQIRLPEIDSLTVLSDTCFILPFNQRLGQAQLRYATIQPLTILNDAGISHYFYFVPEGLEPEYCFAQSSITQVSGDCEQQVLGGHLHLRPQVGPGHHIDLQTANGQTIRLTTLTRTEAEHTWKGEAWGAERVIVSNADLVFTEGRVEARDSQATWEMTVWPPLNASVTTRAGTVGQSNGPVSTALTVTLPTVETQLEVKPISDRKYIVRLPGGLPGGLNNVFLKVDYEGDTCLAFDAGRLVADNFNNGTPWLIGLKRFAPALAGDGLCLVFSPLRKGIVKNVSSQLAGRFEFEGQERLQVHSLLVIPEYQACLELAP